jgi:hypothetical protein
MKDVKNSAVWGSLFLTWHWITELSVAIHYSSISAMVFAAQQKVVLVTILCGYYDVIGSS